MLSNRAYSLILCGGIFSAEVSAFQIILSCVRLAQNVAGQHIKKYKQMPFKYLMDYENVAPV